MATRHKATPGSFKLEMSPAALVDHLERELNIALRAAKKHDIQLHGRRWTNPLRDLVIGSRLEPKPRLGVRTKVAGPSKAARFNQDLATARQNARTELGDEWVFVPGAAIGADCKAYRSYRFTDRHGQVWAIKGPRDRTIPAARYWPGGELPPGLVFNSGQAPVDIDLDALEDRCRAHARQNLIDVLRYARRQPLGPARQGAMFLYQSYFSVAHAARRIARKARQADIAYLNTD